MRTTGYTQDTMNAARRAPLEGLVDLVRAFVPLPDSWNARRDTPYAPANVFWLFLGQTCSADKSCTEVVAQYAARRAAGGAKTPSPDSGAYCKARARLPIEDLRTIHQELIAQAHEPHEAQGLWCGRRVRVVDGSSVSMPDTPENQRAYPQPSPQKPGCGFPVMRLVVIFSLCTGAILAFAKSGLRVAERPLFRQLWDTLAPADVVLADRGFCSYADAYLLGKRRVDWVMRKHHSRTRGVTLVRRLGKGDRLVLWHKNATGPKWMTPEQWDALPDRLCVRELTITVDIPGFRAKTIVVATSLLDRRAFPPHSFVTLYRQRWYAELFLRDIKITLGMDVLRCKTPERVEKELLMHLIAYNLLRAVMLRAATRRNASPLRISFKTALATLRQWEPILACTHDADQRAHLIQEMLRYLERATIPNRPDRFEPRARKRRPKAYPLLVKPRQQYKNNLP